MTRLPAAKLDDRCCEADTQLRKSAELGSRIALRLVGLGLDKEVESRDGFWC